MLYEVITINACPENGRVYLPNGIYKVTSLFLKSHILIDLAENAVISAIPDRTMYPILPGIIEGNDEETEYNFGTWEGRITSYNVCYTKLLRELFGQPVEVLVPMGARGHHPKLRAHYNQNPDIRHMVVGKELFRNNFV